MIRAVSLASFRRVGVGATALAIIAAVLAAGCGGRSELTHHRLYAMGTWVSLSVRAPGPATDAAMAQVEALLRLFEVDYHAWADGELARLNEALAAGRTAEVSPPLAALLKQAQQLGERSGGRFDAGLGTLVELWGFDGPPTEHTRPPSDAAVATALASAGMRHVRVDGRQVAADSTGVKIDLGGIAKGEAVDRIIDTLRRHGIHDALVDAGGDVRAIGTRGDRPWRIGIRHPREDGSVLGVLELEDGEAAFTSGDYERHYDIGGVRMHHIIDPRTGRPALETLAVTVVMRSGVAADAAATALFVAGDDWRETAAALGASAVLRVAADRRVETTASMRAALQDPEGADGRDGR